MASELVKERVLGDVMWEGMRAEAREWLSDGILAGMLEKRVLGAGSFEEALGGMLAGMLGDGEVDVEELGREFTLVFGGGAGALLREDLEAVYERDPACRSHLEAFLYFKGYHALCAYRGAHEWWRGGRKELALWVQSRTSRALGLDIHPAAEVGGGVMMDHATGIVVGETARIGGGTSLLHGVTLGGTGSHEGDRHPKVGEGVLVGAGATVLGPVKIGDGALVGAGSMVLSDVPARSTVVGVPARVVGKAREGAARRLDHAAAGCCGEEEGSDEEEGK